MGNDSQIKTYLNSLSKHLSKIPQAERVEIIDEIRGHLEQRRDEDRLDEALKAMGAPSQCAREFYEQAQIRTALQHGGMSKTMDTLVGFATKRVMAAIGLLASSILLIFAIAFGFVAVAKIIAPEHVGLWLTANKNLHLFGFTSSPPGHEFTEILGLGIVPVAAILAVTSVVVGHAIGRSCLMRMSSDDL